MEKGTKKKLKLKGIYKDMLALLTGAGIIVFTTKMFANQPNEFETYKGKRDLKDYEDFLEDHGIDYRNSYVKTEGDLVRIFVKTTGEHIVTLTNPNTIDEIVELYKMKKEDFITINNLKEDQPLKTGKKLKIYWYKEFDFTLEQLDATSEWIYHYVMPGETLSGISEKYNISIDEIKKENREIIGDEIKAYSTIKIPKREKTKKLVKN